MPIYVRRCGKIFLRACSSHYTERMFFSQAMGFHGISGRTDCVPVGNRGLNRRKEAEKSIGFDIPPG